MESFHMKSLVVMIKKFVNNVSVSRIRSAEKAQAIEINEK